MLKTNKTKPSVVSLICDIKPLRVSTA